MTEEMDRKVTTRRGALGLGAGSLMIAATAEAEPAAPADPLRRPDLEPRDRGAAAGGHQRVSSLWIFPTAWWRGVKPGEAVRPLFDFQVFSTIRVVRLADGNYQRMTKEVVFYTDLKTGAILDEWKNPYTGETVKVVDIANDPYNWIIASTVQPPAHPRRTGHGPNGSWRQAVLAKLVKARARIRSC